jgi:hypothetical protein
MPDSYHYQGQVPLAMDHCPSGANFAEDRRPNWEIIPGPCLRARAILYGRALACG